MRTLSLFLLFTILSKVSFAQKYTLADTVKANQYYEIGDSLLDLKKYDSAYIFFEKSELINENLEIWEKYYLSQTKILEYFWRAGKFERATIYANNILSNSYKQLGSENLIEGRVYYSLAIINFYKSDLNTAISETKKSLRVRTKVFGEFHREISDSYNLLGVIYNYLGKYDSALYYLNKDLVIAEKLLGENHLDLSYSYGTIASIYVNQEKFQLAFEYFQKENDVLKENLENNNQTFFSHYNNVGVAYQQMGDYNQALDNYNRSIKIFRYNKVNNHELVRVLTNIGGIYIYKGNYDLALECFNKTVKIIISEFGETHIDISTAYQNIGIIYRSLGKYDLSLEYLEKSLEINMALFGVNHTKIAVNYFEIGDFYLFTGKTDLALKNFEKSLDIAKKINQEDFISSAVTLNRMGEILILRGEFVEALNKLNKSLAILEKSPNNFRASQSSKLKGDLYAKQNNYEKAIKYYNEGIKNKNLIFNGKNQEIAFDFNSLAAFFYERNMADSSLFYYHKAIIANNQYYDEHLGILDDLSKIDYKGFFDSKVLLESLFGKARSLKKLYEKEKKEEYLLSSLNTYLFSDSLMNLTRASYQNYQDKLTFNSISSELYQDAIELFDLAFKHTKNIRYLEKALFFSERNKSSILSENLNAYQTKQFAGIPDSLLQKERDNKIDIAYYQSELLNEKNKPEKDSNRIQLYEDKLFTLNRDQEGLNEQLKTDFPQYYELKYVYNVPSLQEIQNQLSSDQTLVSYQIGNSTSYVFTITQDDFSMIPLEVDTTLTRKIETLQTSLKNQDITTYTSLAHQLYKTLINPLKDKIQGEDLIIIPDGSLWYLNFGLLLSESTSSQDFRELPYLLKDYNLSYHYSANLMLKEDEINSDNLKECLAFSFSNDEVMQEGGQLVMRNFRDVSGSDLPGTRKEIAGISNIMDGAYYYGNLANEKNFKEQANKYAVLHLALHGETNAEEPMNSKLYFTQDADSLEDNYLHAFELYNMELNADLAVLSACNTGSGEIAAGEGIMSLGRAFSYAGVKSLVLSQWELSDAAAPSMMETFYSELKEGQSKSAALRKAQLDYLENADNISANPYYWGALVHIGNDKPLDLNDSFLEQYGYYLLALFILPLVFFFRRKKSA